jgi:hypothetical protein
MKSHHVTTYREDRLKEVSAGTVLKYLGLLSAVINTGRTEWGLENVLRVNPVSFISKPLTATLCLTLAILLSAGCDENTDSPIGIAAIESGAYATVLRDLQSRADQGNVSAQLNLGLQYHKGQGVIQDNVYAHMWGNIAVSNGHKKRW